MNFIPAAEMAEISDQSLQEIQIRIATEMRVDLKDKIFTAASYSGRRSITFVVCEEGSVAHRKFRREVFDNLAAELKEQGYNICSVRNITSNPVPWPAKIVNISW